jgi:hypothetical protein
MVPLILPDALPYRGSFSPCRFISSATSPVRQCRVVESAVLYWECKRRLRQLKVFRELVVSYFRDSQEKVLALYEGDKARLLRPQINLRLNQTLQSMHAVGESATFTGERFGRVDALTNMFQLRQLRIPRQAVLDSLDRTIGEYERMQRHLFRQLFNPLYWLGLMVAIPFRILEFAGFNADKIEKSFSGRLYKAIASFAALVAAILEILDRLGWLDRVKVFFHTLSRLH